jgi:RHS repeat-associated protein
VASLLVFTMLAPGCGILLSQEQSPIWNTTETVYFHNGFGPGAVLLTRTDGSVLEERRHEPFGAPIDSFRQPTGGGAGTTGTIDYALEPSNALGKFTDPTTGWSFHGARWMNPGSARWLTPDPPVKGPSPEFMAKPWALNPYQYVLQNPLFFWDPDGREETCVATHHQAHKATMTRIQTPVSTQKGTSFQDLVDFASAPPPPSAKPATPAAPTVDITKVDPIQVDYSIGPQIFAGFSYVLTEDAARLYDPTFKPLGLDVREVTFSFGWTPDDALAFTIGYKVTINKEKWDAAKPAERWYLLSHEMAHTVQQNQMGLASFGLRYKDEFALSYGQNYQLNPRLRNMAFKDVDLTDPHFTLDQLANRLQLHFKEENPVPAGAARDDL